MTRIPTSRLAVAGAVLMGIVVLSAGLWHQRLGQALAGSTGGRLSGISSAAHHGLAFFSTLFSRRDLAAENMQLKDKLQRAQTDSARMADLEHENAFLRDVAGLHKQLARDLVDGAGFSYPREGGVRELVINRGTVQGVLVGDIVVSVSGALVGTVRNVFGDHAVIRTIEDPAMEITARLADGTVAGLVRSDLRSGLILDLVQKDEMVTEGQTVVTSGNDQFPPGLVIGTVRSVDNDSATLFKIVRISSTLGETFQGRVVIFHP